MALRLFLQTVCAILIVAIIIVAFLPDADSFFMFLVACLMFFSGYHTVIVYKRPNIKDDEK